MKGRKVIVYITNTAILVMLYLVTLFISPDVLHIVGSVIIGAITLIAMTFIGGVVYSQWIKSKHFNRDLHN